MESSPPGSPLSELSSDEFADDTKSDIRSMSMDTPHHDPESLRPIKRLKLTNLRNATTPQPPIEELDGDITSDTDGSVPASPTHPGTMNDEDSLGADQVTICKWERCDAGDLDNMDNLVKHLHEEHIDKSQRGIAPPQEKGHANQPQKKYSCEWSDCARKGIPHASGYALRAHMRSHTREKPFYCTLPECDRAFTRSDALAKHMRTVHETEALRPSDPVPKHHSSHILKQQGGGGRLKLVFNKGTNGTSEGPDKSNASTPAPQTATEKEYEDSAITYIAGPSGREDDYEAIYPADNEFTDHELSLPPDQLFRLLRRQLKWAQQDHISLKTELEDLEAERKKAFLEKELVMENIMEVESVVITLKGIPTGPDGECIRSRIKEDARPAKALELNKDKKPWWREEQYRNIHLPVPAFASAEEAAEGVENLFPEG